MNTELRLAARTPAEKIQWLIAFAEERLDALTDDQWGQWFWRLFNFCGGRLNASVNEEALERALEKGNDWPTIGRDFFACPDKHGWTPEHVLGCQADAKGMLETWAIANRIRKIKAGSTR